MLIEETKIPLGYRSIQAANLVGWKGESSHPEINQLFEAVAGVLGEVVVEKKVERKEPLLSESMLFIKGGSFEMGDIFGGGDDNEKPVHKVSVDDFYMGQCEVTVREFRGFVEDSGYKTEAEKGGGERVLNSSGDEWELQKGVDWRSPEFSQDDNHPVVQVSWNDANAYIEWLSRKDGKEYRHPKGPSSGEYRSLRGGSWDLGPEVVRVAFRFRYDPDYRYNFTGFRVVCSAR